MTSCSQRLADRIPQNSGFGSVCPNSGEFGCEARGSRIPQFAGRQRIRLNSAEFAYGLRATLLASLALLVAAVSLQAQTRVNPRPGESAQDQRRSAAEQAYQQGDFLRVLELTTSMIEANSRDAVAFYLRGSARVELGRAQRDNKAVRNGIADARQAIAIGGTDQAVYYLPYLYGMTNLAALENRKSHAEVALKIAGDALAQLRLKPEEKANLHYQRALTQVFLGNFEAAIADYQQAMDLVPAHLGAYVGLADAYAAAGQKEKALAAFDKTVAAFPQNPLVFNNRGMYVQQQGKFADAIVDFTRAIEIDPNYHYAYTNRGYALMNQGDPQAAEGDFTAALKVAGDQPMVYSLRGTSRLAQGRIADAVADYEKVIQLDGRNSIAHADLGFARYFAKDYTVAAAEFSGALKLDPKLRYLEPWRFIALDAAGEGEQAKQLAADRLKESKESTDPESRRDWIDSLLSYLLGTLDEAQLIQAVAPPADPLHNAQQCEAQFFIAERHSRAGNTDSATEHYQQALDTKATHLSAYRGAQFALKKFAAAAK
jgi:lipoprotein NlpI